MYVKSNISSRYSRYNWNGNAVARWDHTAKTLSFGWEMQR